MNKKRVGLTGSLWTSMVQNFLKYSYRKKAVVALTQDKVGKYKENLDECCNRDHFYSALGYHGCKDMNVQIMIDENEIIQRSKYFNGDSFHFLNSTVAAIASLNKQKQQNIQPFFFAYCLCVYSGYYFFGVFL